MYELLLWEKLKQMGFEPLTIVNEYSKWTKFVNWLFNKEPLKLTSVYYNCLTKTIDGKYVVISVDFSYVEVHIKSSM